MQYAKNALNEYKAVEVDASVLAANPHELIVKLMSGAINSIQRAKQYMLKQDIPSKSQHIKAAMSIIADGLRSSLNMEAGGEIAANLDALYEYMLQRLMTAHARNDPAALDEVLALLNEVKAGWDGIKP
jgi:flagellar protein FliS